MNSIIEQFTTLARSEYTEAKVKGDLNELIRDSVAASQRSGLQVTAHLNNLPLFSFQPLAMRRALSNLLENARRYGREPVDVYSRMVGGEAEIRIADRGPGVPDAELERLLQPFTRLDHARGSPGTGLGLAIVARIVAAHDGRVVIKNRPQGGLEVSSYLPVNKSA